MNALRCRTIPARCLVVSTLLALPLMLYGQAPAPLANTLARLDAASARFTSAQADVHKDLFNALVKDTTTQNGSTYFLRSKSGQTQMGARITGPGARTVEYKNGIVRDYNPGLNCFDSVSAAKNQATIESFLVLGFGGSGKDLVRSWTVSDLGSETMMDGTKSVKVEKLDLVPREVSVRNNVTHVTLWLDLDRGVSLKQTFFSPSGDYQTAVYSNIRLNEKINTRPFEIKGSPCGK